MQILKLSKFFYSKAKITKKEFSFKSLLKNKLILGMIDIHSNYQHHNIKIKTNLLSYDASDDSHLQPSDNKNHKICGSLSGKKILRAISEAPIRELEKQLRNEKELSLPAMENMCFGCCDKVEEAKL